MSYASQSLLSQDYDFNLRVSACAAIELNRVHDPQAWARDHIWRIASSPGFADSYEYAMNTDVARPGWDPAVITDEQILAAVQAEIELETG